MNIQEQYINLYRELHKTDEFPGTELAPHVDAIAALVKQTNSTTLLDFGCGKGQQYSIDNLHECWGGILPTLYDPGFPEHDVKPDGLWDGVICTDVLEHVPEAAIRDVLGDIISRSNKFVFLNVSIRVARAVLPNGENAHCTVKPPEWWGHQVAMVQRSLSSKAIIRLECSTLLNDPRTVKML